MRRRVLASVGAAVLALSTPTDVAAQDSVSDMIAECHASNALLFQACTDAGLALGATRAGVGLAASQGSAVPGSASTLGRRMASSPRLAFSVRTGVARARFGDPADGRVRTFWPLTVEGQVTVGILEGWSLAPTVGGFLSLDLFGDIGFASLSTGAGFEGSARDLGYGARVGVFRESFTLPGVSASITRRHLGEINWGPATGDGTRLTFKPTVTSLRATASKDLLSFGVLGGWGWDRYAGGSSLVVRRTAGTLAAQASSDDFHTDRQVLFGGLSYTLLVLQLSVEGGWASGFSGPTSASSGFKPRTSSFFGSVAARLTY
jgi:hypothetical protein